MRKALTLQAQMQDDFEDQVFRAWRIGESGELVRKLDLGLSCCNNLDQVIGTSLSWHPNGYMSDSTTLNEKGSKLRLSNLLIAEILKEFRVSESFLKFVRLVYFSDVF